MKDNKTLKDKIILTSICVLLLIVLVVIIITNPNQQFKLRINYSINPYFVN